MNRLLTLPIVFVAVLGTANLRAQTVSYDTFMKEDANTRQERFARLTANDKAAILREQLNRWRRHHADRLSSEQDQLLADIAGFIRPDFFGSSLHDDATKTAFLALEERISKAFTPEDAFEAFTINGAYLTP